MSGQPPSADSNGNLYVSVANGHVGNRTNPQTPGDRVESFLRLTRSGTNLTVASSFTPYNWTALEDGDLDPRFCLSNLLSTETLASRSNRRSIGPNWPRFKN